MLIIIIMIIITVILISQLFPLDPPSRSSSPLPLLYSPTPPPAIIPPSLEIAHLEGCHHKQTN